MEARVLQDMIAVIRAEQVRRETQLDNVDTRLQYDQWQFTDLPFVNELYLMILVTLRHQVERELVKIAALEGDNGNEISSQEYAANVQQERERLRKKGWEQLATKLKLEQCVGYRHMEVLRLLANSYKHDPWVEPDEKLLELLNLRTDVKYAPLPESMGLQEGLAQFVGLHKNAPCCDTAERFVSMAGDYLEDVRKLTALRPFKRERVSLNPNDFLH